jgi:hypothetical protein
MSKKILSISSASDWWAGYGNPQTGEQQNFHRIIAFALCEDEGNQRIVAIDTADFEEGIGSTVEDADNYRGIYHSSEFAKLGEELTPVARDRFLKGVS